MCVCAHSNNRSAKVFKMIEPSNDLFCARHVCIQKHRGVCSEQQLVGQPSILGCNPHLISSATHMCVCAHRSEWSAKVVECSEPSLDIFVGSFCNTHVCVHSSSWSVNLRLTSSATHVCTCSQQQSVAKIRIKASIDLFCTRHVCIFRNTHVYAHRSSWSASYPRSLRTPLN